MYLRYQKDIWGGIWADKCPQLVGIFLVYFGLYVDFWKKVWNFEIEQNLQKSQNMVEWFINHNFFGFLLGLICPNTRPKYHFDSPPTEKFATVQKWGSKNFVNFAPKSGSLRIFLIKRKKLVFKIHLGANFFWELAECSIADCGSLMTQNHHPKNFWFNKPQILVFRRYYVDFQVHFWSFFPPNASEKPLYVGLWFINHTKKFIGK